MLDNILNLTTEQTTFSTGDILLNTAFAAVFGIIIAYIYMYKNTYNKSFVMTLAVLPIVVQSIIMLVNGNVGTGVAVMGAFSLIRFRSVPGSAKEIGSIFLAMAVGLACGIGAPLYAALVLTVIALLTIIFVNTKFAEQKTSLKELKITIPEDLDYSGIFDDIFEGYTKSNELIRVKTTNMGSLYELCYHITLKNAETEKEFIDKIRCRNGNLNIVCGRLAVSKEEL